MTEYKIYLDSDVFISRIRTEIDRTFNLNFLDTETFLIMCSRRGIKVVLSDVFFEEVKRVVGLEKKDVMQPLKEYSVAVELVHGTENTEESAKLIHRKTCIHLSDAKHVSLALEAGCDMLVTWNKKDFEKARDYIPCANPRDFVSTCENIPQSDAPCPPA